MTREEKLERDYRPLAKVLWIIVLVVGGIFLAGDTINRVAENASWLRVAVEWVNASGGYLAEGMEEAVEGGLLWYILGFAVIVLGVFWAIVHAGSWADLKVGRTPMDGLDARALLGAADAESAEGICVNCLQVETLCSCIPCDDCGTMLATKPVPNAPSHMKRVFGIFAEPYGKPVAVCQDCGFRAVATKARTGKVS